MNIASRFWGDSLGDFEDDQFFEEGDFQVVSSRYLVDNNNDNFTEVLSKSQRKK